MSEFKLVIDNDAGGDDAMAIFLALMYEKYFDGPKVIGLTTVIGNSDEENVYINNQRVLQVAKRQDVPIYRGSKASLVKTPPLRHFYGQDGLGDICETLTDVIPAQELDAVSALIQLSKIHDNNLIVVTTGPVTNVAKAIQLDPAFLDRLAHLYVAAGHIQSEKHPVREFNVYMDAEAYDVIIKNANPEKVTVLPFSQVKDCLSLPKAWRLDLLGAIDSDIIKAQNKFEAIAISKRDCWQSLDPAGVAVALRPELVEQYKYSKHGVILDGDSRAINTNIFTEKKEANVRVIYSIKQEEYKKFLIEVFARSK